jgi:cell division protein FtsQ
MLKKSGIKAKTKRMQRRVTGMSGDVMAAAGMLFLAAIFTVLFIYSYSVLVSIPYFQVKEVSVRGLKELTEKDVLTSAEIKQAQNLLAVNKDAVIRRVSQNQWVKDVYVGRELPDKLVLEVRERVPLALLRHAGDFYLVDIEGFIFKKLGRNDEVDLPIITGVDQQKKTKSPLFLSTLSLLKTLSSAGQYAYLGSLSEVHIDEVFGISLISGNGLYLKLGTKEFEKKISHLKAVLDDLEKRGMKNGYLCVDLSDESKVTVQRKNVPEPVKQDDGKKHYLI